MSDIAGQDIRVHRGHPDKAITEVRDWLVGVSKTLGVPGGMEIGQRYMRFANDLPRICERLKRHPKNLTFADFFETVDLWLEVET